MVFYNQSKKINLKVQTTLLDYEKQLLIKILCSAADLIIIYDFGCCVL